MQYHIEEYGKYVEITGYKGINFAAAEQFLKANRKTSNQNISLQFFDASLIATYEHLYFAVLNALQAFQNKTNISKSLAMETMLYASAQRQIQRAIDLCGIKPETTSMAVVIIADKPTELQTMLVAITQCIGMETDDTVLELSESKETKIKEAFEISNEALATVMKNGDRKAAIVNLVIERIALLSTQL